MKIENYMFPYQYTKYTHKIRHVYPTYAIKCNKHYRVQQTEHLVQNIKPGLCVCSSYIILLPVDYEKSTR